MRMTLAASKDSPTVGARRRTPVVARLMFVALIGASIGACSTIEDLNPFGTEKYRTKIEPDVPPTAIYDQGLARLQKGDEDGAAKKFVELGKQYPYSDWSKKGLLMTTYSQYQSGDYDSAEQSAQRYIKLYPTSPDTPYVMYLEAMSYYSQIPDISRDQDRAAKSMFLFQQLVEKFPNSEYSADAKFKI